MPTYRRPGLLRQALASAVGQTYDNLQIIVRDNASGDETADVVRSFRDPRVHFLQSTKTGTAWENGLEIFNRVEGQYFMPLCDDDVLGTNYVATLLRYLEQDNTIKAAYGATCVIDENGTITSKRTPNGTCLWQGKETIRAWCNGDIPLVSGINYVCRTAFIRELLDVIQFPEGHHSDNAVFMAAAIQGKVLFTDECIFYYRKHNQNSERSLPCQLRAQGDRRFLEFLDEQVRSERNVGMPKAEWPGLRAELLRMLAYWYFDHLLRCRLENESLLKTARNTMFYPARTYGLRITLRLLRRSRKRLQRELRKALPTRPGKLGQLFENSGIND